MRHDLETSSPFPVDDATQQSFSVYIRSKDIWFRGHHIYILSWCLSSLRCCSQSTPAKVDQNKPKPVVKNCRLVQRPRRVKAVSVNFCFLSLSLCYTYRPCFRAVDHFAFFTTATCSLVAGMKTSPYLLLRSSIYTEQNPDEQPFRFPPPPPILRVLLLLVPCLNPSMFCLFCFLVSVYARVGSMQASLSTQKNKWLDGLPPPRFFYRPRPRWSSPSSSWSSWGLRQPTPDP